MHTNVEVGLICVIYVIQLIEHICIGDKVQLQLLSHDMGLSCFLKYFQRKSFLEKALKSMTVDVIETLLRAIDILKTAGNLELEDDPTESEEALEQIASYVDNMDTANGLCNVVFWFIIILNNI
jgi:hypothetical protein